MKKLFAIVAVMGALTFGSTQLAQAQDQLNWLRPRMLLLPVKLKLSLLLRVAVFTKN